MQHITLSFPFLLHPGAIPLFRGAIINAVGLGHTLFHGHDNSEQGATHYRNELPLIRYTVHKGKARIIGIGAGADAIIRYLLPNLPDQLLLGERYCPTAGYRFQMNEWPPEILPEPFAFGLHRYLALNKDNYQKWKSLEGQDDARQMLLSGCLTGHLRALAEATAPQLDRSQIEATILSVDEVKRLRWHNNHFVGFSLVAAANFIPPWGIGVGRATSFGFGEVCSQKQYYRLLRPKSKRNKQREAAVKVLKNP